MYYVECTVSIAYQGSNALIHTYGQFTANPCSMFLECVRKLENPKENAYADTKRTYYTYTTHNVTWSPDHTSYAIVPRKCNVTVLTIHYTLKYRLQYISKHTCEVQLCYWKTKRGDLQFNTELSGPTIGVVTIQLFINVDLDLDS